MSIAPRFWIALSFLTMTFFFDMAIAPLERQTVTIMGSISGVRPTATESPKSRASTQLCLVRPTMRKVTETMISIRRTISLTKDFSPLSKSVGSFGAVIAAETLPRKVLMPVLTATPLAAPETTVDPWKQAFGREKVEVPSVPGEGSFSTGMDSPVRADWLT